MNNANPGSCYMDSKLNAELESAATDTLLAVAYGEGVKATRKAALAEIRKFLSCDVGSWLHQTVRARLCANGFRA